MAKHDDYDAQSRRRPYSDSDDEFVRTFSVNVSQRPVNGQSTLQSTLSISRIFKIVFVLAAIYRTYRATAPRLLNNKIRKFFITPAHTGVAKKASLTGGVD